MDAYLFANRGALPRRVHDRPQTHGAPSPSGAERNRLCSRVVLPTRASGRWLRSRARYGFSPRFVAVSCRLIAEIGERGPFYRSTFADYVAMNAVFLRARQIIV